MRYNAILRGAFATRVHDAQCGFKAMRADVARRLLPAVVDDAWFFDTELLLLAEHNGLRIHQVPVDWIDDADSRVHIARTALDDLRGAARMVRRFATGDGEVDLGPVARSGVADDFGRRFVTFAVDRRREHRDLARACSCCCAFRSAPSRPMRSPSPRRSSPTRGPTPGTPRGIEPAAVAPRARRLRRFARASPSVALAFVVAAGGGLGAELATLVVTWSLATARRFLVLGGAR